MGGVGRVNPSRVQWAAPVQQASKASTSGASLTGLIRGGLMQQVHGEATKKLVGQKNELNNINKALNTLAEIQNLRNNVTIPPNAPSISWPPTKDQIDKYGVENIIEMIRKSPMGDAKVTYDDGKGGYKDITLRDLLDKDKGGVDIIQKRTENRWWRETPVGKPWSVNDPIKKDAFGYPMQVHDKDGKWPKTVEYTTKLTIPRTADALVAIFQQYANPNDKGTTISGGTFEKLSDNEIYVNDPSKSTASFGFTFRFRPDQGNDAKNTNAIGFKAVSDINNKQLFPTGEPNQEFVDKLVGYKKQLEDILGKIPDKNSDMYKQIQKAVANIDECFGITSGGRKIDPISAAKVWLLDNKWNGDLQVKDEKGNFFSITSNPGKRGDYQSNITFATTTSSMSRDDTNAATKQELFKLDEFNKMVIAIMKAESDIIMGMAKKTSG